MKRTILLLLAVTTALSCLFAQTTKNPFSNMGYKKQITYTSSKGEFEEFHDKVDIVEIGSVYFNSKTKKVVGYVNEEKENTEVASATSAMSVDPLCEKYYWISPYAYCLNNPVKYIDPDGREVWIAHRFDDGKTTSVQYKNGTLYNSDGSKYKGSNPYILTTSKHLNQLKTASNETNTIISSLDADDNKHTITNLDLANPSEKGNFNRKVSILSDGLIEGITESGGTVTKYDSDATSNVRGQKRDPKVGLIHELKHAYDTSNGGLRAGQTSTGVPNYEVDAVNVENQVRSKTADPKRTEYGGKKIPNKDLK